MWPNESNRYREHRNKLLQAEARLRAQIEEVASLRKKLPDGGRAKEDYLFIDAQSEAVCKLSDLFANDKDTLVLYNLMFKQTDTNPCVMCASLLDSLNGAATHVGDRMNLAIIAKASADKISNLSKQKNWNNLRFLSSAENSYNLDYGAETADGNQWPMLHVWKKSGDNILHFWGSELFRHKDPNWEGQSRHVDAIWPLWNLLDLTPQGRGTDWYPKNSY